MLQRLSSTLCPLPRHLPRLPRSHAVHTALPSFNRSSSSSKRKSSASDNDSTMSSAKTKTPFGAFPSPISSNVVLSSSISLVDVLVTSDGTIVWVEGRPMEEGRNAIVAQSADGAHVEIIPNENGLNARTQIHEYGGASVGTVMNDVIFSEIHGPVFKAERSAEGVWTKAKQITPTNDVHRFADFGPHPTIPTLVASILEDHSDPANVLNSIVLIDTASGSFSTIASGRDFYAFPSFSNSGKYISFTSWVHPEMPWTKSSLFVLEVTRTKNGLSFGELLKVAGEGKESVSQPRWHADRDILIFLSDRSDYAELYSWDPTQGAFSRPLLKEPTGADVGGPDWTLGNCTHFCLGGDAWISKAEKGKLRVINLLDNTSLLIPTPYRSISTLRVVSRNEVVVIASSSAVPTQLARLTLSSDRTSVSTSIIKSSSSVILDPAFISKAEHITFPAQKIASESDEESVAHAWYYQPSNGDHQGLDGELTPLIVHCHGGPTSAAGAGLSYMIQYFTSRGFAYVDLNYGGSTGYGRTYRERLDGNWGVVDVNDSISCVEYLVKEKNADPKRVSIVGGSAGGYTVLAALCATKCFTAGVSLYGVSDVGLLCAHTHKFEQEYLFGLLGGTPEQIPDVYVARSPINNAGNITCPLLLLQGSIDKVVPIEQATLMAERITKAPVEVIIFEGEGHGFRRYDSKKRAMESELHHYRKTWSIEAAEKE